MEIERWNIYGGNIEKMKIFSDTRKRKKKKKKFFPIHEKKKKKKKKEILYRIYRRIAYVSFFRPPSACNISSDFMFLARLKAASRHIVALQTL